MVAKLWLETQGQEVVLPGLLGEEVKIPASKLKAWRGLFERYNKTSRYTLTVFADTKARAIKIIKKYQEHPKDKLLSMKRDHKTKLGGYYKGRSVNV